MRSWTTPLLLILVGTGLGGGIPPTHGATINVDSTADDADQGANGNCTLREAILAANSNAPVDGCLAGEPGPGTIDVVALPSGTYQLTLGPRGDDAAAHGDLDLTDDVDIVGSGADTTRIDADRLDRVFDVHEGLSVFITDLEVRRGDAGAGNGGGIQNSGDLALENVAISDNLATGSGGGIRNNSQLTVRRSLLAGNATADHGGGIDNHGDAVFENATVNGNDGGNLGGGLYNLAGMSLEMRHCTVDGNVADSGPAIHNAGDLTAANNLILGTCSGTINTTGGGNLEGPGDTCGLGTGDTTGVTNPRLGALAANGGPTLSQALLAGSPAIDAALTGPCLATDQRGETRPVDGDGNRQADCDAGAFESQTVPSALIFADGFESGNISSWV